MTNQETDYRELLMQAMATIDELEARNDELANQLNEPLAIVGVACRLPGGANSPDLFWELLKEGRETITPIPEDRWGEPLPVGHNRFGSFLEDTMQFDPLFFNISPREAAMMDPQQRLLLMVAWEAFENAGIQSTQFAGSPTGVFIGSSAHDYDTKGIRDYESGLYNMYRSTGCADAVQSGRISYALGLNGPSVTMDTACSSSLLAIHVAGQSLRTRECNMALAGGVNLMLDRNMFLGLSSAQMLAPDGRCKSFDAGANGYVRGEGCGLVVLKRLSDAQADGDRILAVIEGSATNQDGNSKGLTVPNAAMQEAVIRSAMDNAGLHPDDVSYIETHGTGTPVGDPLEMAAIGAVYRERDLDLKPVQIGSVKTNIGHLEAASGFASLLKVIMAMQHKELPAHLNLNTLNPEIPWDHIPVEVTTSHRPWELDGQERRVAGISGYGFSGSNVHIVVAEAPPMEAEVAPALEARPVNLLTISGKGPGALEGNAESYADYLESSDVSFVDIAASSNRYRSHLDGRLAVVAADKAAAAQQIRQWLAGKPAGSLVNGKATQGRSKPVAFMFTGQGAQYVNMGRDLYAQEPVFRAAFDDCLALFEQSMDRSLKEIIFADDDEVGALINQTAYTQPALFTVEYALAQLWLSWGVQPSVVLGHSIGEYAAACIAGVFSLEDATRLVAARGRLMQAQPEGGAMAAVMATADQVEAAVARQQPNLDIAAYNGPKHIVVSGQSDAVAALTAEMEAAGVTVKQLRVSHAFHSHMMDPMLEQYRAVAEKVTYNEPELWLVSNVTGTFADDQIATADYWVRHIRLPVRFAQAIDTLAEEQYEQFIEVGPQPVLLGMARQAVEIENAIWLPSLRRKRDELATILQSLGHFHVNGGDVDWTQFHTDRPQSFVNLPFYTFQDIEYTYPEEFKRKESATLPQLQPFINQRIESPHVDGTLFQATLSVESHPFLAEHRVMGQIIFPGAGLLEMAAQVAREMYGEGVHTVENFAIHEALIIPEEGTRTVQIRVTQRSASQAQFEIHSLTSREWKRHVVGGLRAGEASEGNAIDVDALKARMSSWTSDEIIYQTFDEIDLNYGPAFSALREVGHGQNEYLGRLSLPEEIAQTGSAYHVHPGLLDCSLQASITLFDIIGNTDNQDGLFLPSGVNKFNVFQPGVPVMWAHVIEESVTDMIAACDINLYAEDGSQIASLSGYRAMKVTRRSLRRLSQISYADWMVEVNWEQQSLSEQPSMPETGRWLIFADGQGHAQTVQQQLTAGGHDVTMVHPAAQTEAGLDGTLHLQPTDHEGFASWLKGWLDASQTPLRGAIYLWGLSVQTPTGDTVLSDQATITGGLNSLARGLALEARDALHASDMNGLWVVTSDAVSADEAVLQPAGSGIWGLGRTLGQEQPLLNAICVDIDTQMDIPATLMGEISSRSGESQVAYRGDTRLVSRLSQAQATELERPDAPAYVLDMTEKGVLENLYLRGEERREVAAGQVEVQIRATGLNFRDVLGALKMYPGDPGPMGAESAGTITRVADDVTTVKVGDEVLLLAPDTMRSHVVVEADRVYHKPANISHAAAATIPITFLTAYYGLHKLADMKKGDKILIHAATGGVGMAAVQLALRVGAEIFGTASSPRKQQLLRDLGVQHIMHSRTLDFADEIMEITNGEGVDLVLNSLADEFIPKSLSVLKNGGHFLEIGKRGIWTNEQVAELNPTLNYDVYDLAQIMTDEYPLTREMLEFILDEMAAGVIAPLPVQGFPITKAADAYRYMAQAKHVGKIILTQSNGDIRDDATYMVTGGLGGVGLQVARWLVEKGARHLVLLSRSGRKASVEEALVELEAAGATIATPKANVSSRSDLEAVMSLIDDSMPPLRGVFHAAGILDDGILTQQEWSRYIKVMEPKVVGTWHLHELTANRGLDFCVFFSSIADVLGSPGQSNYAAANSFMDGVASYRRWLGLPAQSISWGAWGQVGMVARNHAESLKSLGLIYMDPGDGVDAMGEAMQGSKVQLGILNAEWPILLKRFGTQPLFETLIAQHAARDSQAGSGSNESSESFFTLLAEEPVTNRHNMLTDHISEQIAAVLGLDPSQPLDVNFGLTDLGMDSLTAVEFSNRLEASLGLTLPPTLAFEAPTIKALVSHLLDLLFEGEAEEADEPEVVEAEAAAPLIDEDVAQLSDEEALESLLDELKETGF